MVAAKEGRVGMVRKMIQLGVDVNLTGKVMDLFGGYRYAVHLYLAVLVCVGQVETVNVPHFRE